MGAFSGLAEQNCLIGPTDDQRGAELDLLRFATLHFGPMKKRASTVSLYIAAISYVRRVQTCVNPCESMPMLRLLLQGMERIGGHTREKLPISRQDLITLQGRLDMTHVDEAIIFCVLLFGRYFMIRKSEYIGPVTKSTESPNHRFSVRMIDIEPHYRFKLAKRSEPIDSISLHIHGSKTDWLNCGAVRTNGQLPNDHPNLLISLVRNFFNLYSLIPGRFDENTQLTFARRANNSLIADLQATRMIRMAVRLKGLTPDQYALHSLRSGGETSLFRETGDLDLVARFGRWKGKIIHGYLRKPHLMLHGIAGLMASDDGPIVHLAAGGETNPGVKTPFGGYKGRAKRKKE